MASGMLDPINNEFLDSGDPFKLEAAKLARRRQLARSLIQQAASPAEQGGYQGGKVFMVGSPLGQIARTIGGQYMQSETDDAAKALQERMQAAQADWQAQYNAATDPAAKQAALVEGRNRGVRTDLEKSFYELDARQNEAEAARQLKAQDIAAEKEAQRLARAQDREDKQAFQAEQNQLYKRTADQLSAAVGRSGGSSKDPEDIELDRELKRARLDAMKSKGKEGKPLTAKQLETQRGFMDMESSLDNYEKMLNSYDPRGSSAASPAARAALEGAYTDVQMKLKTLYELGAPQAGDLKLLSQSIPNPTDLGGTLRGAAFGSAPFKAKLGETKKLLNTSRANFETQLGKETPEAARSAGASGSWDAKPAQSGAPVRRKYNPATGDFE